MNNETVMLEAQREVLQAQVGIAQKALIAAQQFIRNGVELGYTRMPDVDTPDPAHETPKLIDAAIRSLSSQSEQCVLTSDSESDSVHSYVPCATPPNVPLNGWISVDEHRPETEAEYITAYTVYGNSYVSAMFWQDGRWQDHDDEGFYDPPHWVDVTHWMPFPKSPTDQSTPSPTLEARTEPSTVGRKNKQEDIAAPSAPEGERELPPLPKPEYEVCELSSTAKVYTADQMHEYALSALAQGRMPEGVEKDAARLDWIEKAIQESSSVWFSPCGDELRFVQIRTPGETRNYPTVPGIRAAIDAAIAAAPSQEEGK